MLAKNLAVGKGLVNGARGVVIGFDATTGQLAILTSHGWCEVKHLTETQPVYLPGCIHSSRPNWFIIHRKRSDTCSRFPAIRYQICSYLLIELNAECRHVSPVWA